MHRRDFTLGMALTAIAGSALTRRAFAQADSDASDTPPGSRNFAFDFDVLTAEARERAQRKYAPPPSKLPEPLADLDYDRQRLIRFNPDSTLWRDQADFQIQAFHLGWLFKEPVHLFTVNGGEATPVGFSTKDFIYQEPLEKERFEGLDIPGIAGFRVLYPLNTETQLDELVAFQGASYFRALGEGSRYGLSARGLALNTASANGEEFPRFSDFYVATPRGSDAALTIYAALDGPSVAGAYKFVIAPGETTRMEVTVRIFMRTDVERLGIAPMTSMFLFNGLNRSAFDDYRERVHDSEGLKIVRRNGDVLWRSLNNPNRLATSFFSEENPRAFGLFQRTRDFDNYQDAGALYERRPSLLVEPLDDWGRGSIGLVEIPTELEVNDNIVCFWEPERKAKAGEEMEFRYRLTWGDIVEDGELARVAHVATGTGGVSGIENDDNTRKFVIDFEGGALRNLFADANVEGVVNASGGEIVHSTVSRIESSRVWRLVIDMKLPDTDAVEINAHLINSDIRLSETWLIQWRSGDEQRS